MNKAVLFALIFALAAVANANEKKTSRKLAGEMPAKLSCGGSEPGWNLNITSEGASLTTLENPSDPTRFQAPKVRNAEGTQTGFALAYDLTTATSGKHATLMLLKQKCVDDADSEHPYSAVYASPIHVFYGCCSEK